MSEQNKAMVRRIVEDHWNKKNPALIGELFATDCVLYTPDGALKGQDGARQLYDAYAAAFPDFRLSTDDLLADGSKVVVRYTFVGTHKGPLAAVPASGKPGECAGHCHLPSSRWQGRRSAFRLGQVRADATDRWAAQ